MTAVTQWRRKGTIARHMRRPLPEPPRYRHVSLLSRVPQDRMTCALEEWLSGLSVARTIDAD